MKLRRSHIPSDADLAALADGSLRANRRIQVERAVSESPRLKSAVAAQRRALAAIDAVSDEPAPAALRARLALAHPPRRAPARLVPAGLMGAVMTAALAAALVLVLTGGAGSPTVVEASVLATLPPQTSVGPPSSPGHTLPGVTEAGLNYPYLEDQFGYRTIGVRRDTFAGRTVTTVLYSRGASRAAYAIVSGPPLRLGQRGWSTTRDGVRFWTLRSSHGPIVTWVRKGHSCILVGNGTAVPVMLRLASWHAGGRVPY
jgi:anti-sigma factor RsiW